MEYWEVVDGREMQEWLDLTGRKAAIYDSHFRKLLKEMCEDGDTFDMRDDRARISDPPGMLVCGLV